MQRISKMQRKATYVRWCYECNVPLLRKKCDICGGRGRAITVSGNGEMRPAFENERQEINRLITSAYGSRTGKLMRKKTIYLAKTSGVDKVDEVIVDGIKIGTLEFDIFEKKTAFIPSTEGCVVFGRSSIRKIRIKKMPKGHLKGKYINSDNIIILSGEKFNIGDYAILGFPNDMVGKGLVKKELTDGANVIKIIDITREESAFSNQSCDISKAITANKGALTIIEKEAKEFIKTTMEKNKKPLTIAFSGGKDSLVVLELLKDLTTKFEIIFIDTGLEFPETIDYIAMMQKRLKKKIRLLKSNKDFYSEAETFGPPAKDYRWCCKTHKLAPVAEYVSLNYPLGCLTFEGKRKNESFSRAMSKREDSNPFVPGQISAYPILDWRALEVWFFILSKKLRYNKLYEMGFERVGCWMCPSGLDCELQNMRDLHPDKFKKFNQFLIDWAESKMLSKKYIRLGFWRWKEYPKKMLKIAETKGINLVPQDKDTEYKVSSVSGIVPCHDKKFSLEGVISGIKDFEKLSDVFNILGSVRYSEELGAITVRTGKCDISLFASGHIVIKSDSKEDAKDMFTELVKTIIRFDTCNLCGICVKTCNRGSIKIVDKKIVVDRTCSHCGKCNDSCHTYKYADKVVDMRALKKKI
ncbi:MAG: phosphoadenosine phosphosulfate reductase family protein [Nanohaloarchaea archaeon]|nr:phosphoadenosine phosphosulfate reductase family protein [Candidatus Nanohaloarchaea archaeon]